MWVYDAATRRVLAVNDTALARFGYSRDEVLRMQAEDLLDPSARSTFAERGANGEAARGSPGSWPVRCRDGTILHADIATQTLVFEGRPAHLALAVDVTDHVRTEQALRISEQKFEAIFLASPLGIYIVEPVSQRIVEANPSFCAIVGIERAGLVGTSTIDSGIWDDPGQRDALVAELLAGRPVRSIEARLRTPAGERRTVLVSMDLLALDQADEPLMVVLVADVTERRSLEEQFRQAQKMEAIGVLAGGVAHDFNNLLSVIIGYSQLLEEDSSLDESGREAIEQIRRAGEQATSLTRQLLAFSRRQVMQLRVLDLSDVVRHIEPMVRRFIGEDIQVRVEVTGTPGQVRADRGQIEQVLMNLAANARDAMPTGGSLTIRVGNADVDAAYAVQHPGLRSGAYVRLTVEDSGVGMSEPTRRRVFEPFFTTKPVGHGTGLGLATVYGIVKQSAGHIRVESAPGRGATFHIDLPRLDEESAAPAQVALPDVRGGTETILLVEDEDVLRELLREVLTRLGYRVITARSGQAAIEVAADGETLHLLLTDVVMPAMSGRELAEHLQTTRPGLKVLYMSGYTADAVLRHGVSTATVNFIEKPMAPSALARKVREVLDQ